MIDLERQLDKLHDRILAADPDNRHVFQPRLTALVDRLDMAGARVPPAIRSLEEELCIEAAEAQFDNMPV